MCFTFGAALKIGWEWEQDSSYPSDTEGLTQGQYTFDLNIFTEQEAEFEIKLFLDRLLSLTPSFNLDKFKAKFKLGLNYFYDTSRLCMYGILSVADFNLDTKLRMALITWKKNVLESLWSYDNWSSRTAKIFDDISLSSEEEVTLYETNVDALTEDLVIYGTKNNEDNASCFDLSAAAAGAGAHIDYANVIAQNVMGYMKDAYPAGYRNEVMDFKTESLQ